MRVITLTRVLPSYRPPTFTGVEGDLVDACATGDVIAAYTAVDTWVSHRAKAQNLPSEKRTQVVMNVQSALSSLMKARHSPVSIHDVLKNKIDTEIEKAFTR